MKMRSTTTNLDSYFGISCLSRWNGSFSLFCGLTQDKTPNSEMGNSNYRITDIDFISRRSQHDLEFSNSDFNTKCSTSAQKGEENSSVANLVPLSKPIHSVSSTGALFSQTSIDFRQPFACVPYTYAESHTGGMFQAYGSHDVLSSNDSRLGSTRVPLPRQPSDEELIYVNPKQYNGIVRRRQLRAKLEAQKKLTRGRKPYLHESRHLHAMRRVRGSGGRFVNTKQHHQRAPHSPCPRSGNNTSSITPSPDVANIFFQNQNNSFNQNNYSDHTSYSKVGGGDMHH